jgi:hypothetical protein
MLKQIVGFSAVALFIAVLTPACASSAQDASDESSDALRSRRSFFACQKDDDCVAVPEAACCHSGRDAAVNIHQTTAYGHSVTCPAHQICPLFLIRETRVAQCGSADSRGKRACEMIEPEAVHCGGFINPSFQHACASGYACDFGGHVPDVPGTCKAVIH